MNASIEYDGKPAFLLNGPTETKHFVAYETAAGFGVVPDGSKLTVCAWCDADKKITAAITEIGHEVSHGICKKCSDGLELPAAQINP
jgi:hypothetical protein